MNYKEIKTWEDACKIHSIDPSILPDVSLLRKDFKDFVINTYKMSVIVEAINTDANGLKWTPDWSNYNQVKYSAWFEINKKGVGFSTSFCFGWSTATDVGSRLLFSDSERVKHAQKFFEEVFIKIFLIE